uniref:Reverse transcriptase domain-containing protein n=1 Tax=Tanacetum cinerariifolium TaxID=118510 RepID=A0A6L2KDT4_TANCI|nr:hypothetical protein [Tanacetum cinerariifolium]
MDQNVDFSGDDQIQNPQYPPSQENSLTNDEFKTYTIANDANMNDLQFKLDNFQKKPQDFQEKFEQMQDDLLNQLRNFMQNLYDGPPGEDKEHEATTDTKLLSTEDIQRLPKQSMEDTMLELVKICQEKEFLCIHNDINDLIESALNSKLLLINSNSQRLDKKEQEVKNIVEQPAKRKKCNIQSLQNFRVVHKSSISSNTSQISSIHAIAPVLSTKEPEHLLSMGYEHLSITPEMESDAENLLPIPSECEVALEDKRECDVPIFENSPICDNSNTFFDSKIDDDISVYDDDFENIEYVEASLFDPEIVKEVDLFLSDNSIPPGIENVADDPGGDIRFLEELLIDDFILSHESPDSNFEDNLSIPRPPPEPPDTETDVREEIPVVMNDKDEDVYSSFIFVIFAKMFSLLSAESEDTIFDPGISD